jgi:acetyl-CoA C-acetyltransferase
MSEVVICEPVRTPVGVFRGVFSGLSAVELATSALGSLLARTGLGEGDIDDVVLGNCYPNGESPAIGRVAALDAGLGTSVPGLQIGCGAADLIIAGGTESMSQVEHYALGLREGVHGDGVQLMDRLARCRVTAGGKLHPVPGGMLETAENLRAKYGISRAEQDELALRSQQACATAVRAGHFDDEIVPVEVPGRHGSASKLISRDEHPRPGMTLDRLAALRPVRAETDPESTVTAGNASGQNDGAALCVVTTRHNADRHQLRPMLSIKSWAVAGVGPRVMGIGPVPATAVALKRADLTLADMDLVELNEAFAAQVIACLREWSWSTADRERLNVNGSGISLGHPVGATGARILATLAYEMHRRGSRYGLETMCIGGGQGLAAIFETVQ